MVHSLKPKYKDQIHFVITDLSTKEGLWFSQFHEVGSVTLVFFRPDGSKITTLQGVQSADFLSRAFDRAFNLKSQ